MIIIPNLEKSMLKVRRTIITAGILNYKTNTKELKGLNIQNRLFEHHSYFKTLSHFNVYQ